MSVHGLYTSPPCLWSSVLVLLVSQQGSQAIGHCPRVCVYLMNILTLGYFFYTKSGATPWGPVHWKNLPSPSPECGCNADTIPLHFVPTYWADPPINQAQAVFCLSWSYRSPHWAIGAKLQGLPFSAAFRFLVVALVYSVSLRCNIVLIHVSIRVLPGKQWVGYMYPAVSHFLMRKHTGITSFYCALLNCASQIIGFVVVVFYKFKALWQPCVE